MCGSFPERDADICARDEQRQGLAKSELDHVDHERWIDDPELEAQLLTYSGRRGYRTDVFEMFYDRDVVSRAGFLIHEVGHAAGLPCHVGEQDRSWEEGGAYRLQLEFLAAVYYADGLSRSHKEAAKAEFTWIMRYKFVDATGLGLEDFDRVSPRERSRSPDRR
jgi:hypothetical protein